MNPPAALYGAMNRERKPFTYTPGGLDLSEIKSERMAKRLMRNAMNQGVPDTPVQPIKSPPASSIPIAIPNYNCLPVQVFPTFQLPANPKSLLRTRSNPDGSSEPINKTNSQFVVNNKSSASLNTNKPCQIPNDKDYNNKELLSNISDVEQKNNNFISSNANNVKDSTKILNPQVDFNVGDSFNVAQKDIQRENIKGDNYYSLPRIQNELNESPLNINMQNNNKSVSFNNYNNGMNSINLLQSGSDCYNDSFILPEISFEAEYLCTLPEKTEDLNDATINNTDKIETCPYMEIGKSQLNKLDIGMDSEDYLKNDQSTSSDINVSIDNYDNNNMPLSPEIYYEAESNALENESNTIKPPDDTICSAKPDFEVLQDIEKNEIHGKIDAMVTSSFKEDRSSDHEQKEVKTVKKQSGKEVKDSEVQNLNGDTEAEIVVKLPSKKSEAKTETQVEVEKKVLPDGTVEEITKTTTKTTVNGKTETKITTSTKSIPKEEVTEEEYEEEEETEENSEEVVQNKKSEDIEDKTEQKSDSETVKDEIKPDDTEKDTLQNDHITTHEEKSETSTTKKVVVIQSESQDSEEEVVEEEEEVIEEESEVEPDVEENVVIKSKCVQESENIENEEASEEEDENKTQIKEGVEGKESESGDKNINTEKDEDEDYEEEVNEIEEPELESKRDQEEMPKKDVQEKEEENNNETKQEKSVNEDEEETEETFEEAVDEKTKVEVSQEKSDLEENAHKGDEKQEVIVEKIIPIQHEHKKEETNITPSTEEIKQIPQSALKDVLREPSVPLEKVEEVEIKPIGPTQEIIKKSHTEIITTKTDKPSGGLSTQTEYNVIENYVTVNRTTKTLDHAYEQTIADNSIPIIRSYIPPYETSTQLPPKTYQSTYPPRPNTEKRHSLLLDRISVERQIPVDTYQNNFHNNNQSYQETQYMFEPQSEVLTESNVKPSTINKNEQWYQQTKKENYINNNASTTPTYDWSPSQQQSVGLQSHQPLYQPQHVPEPQYQTSYTENTIRDSYKTVTDKQNVSSYISKPTWVNSTYDPKPTMPSQPVQYSTNQSTESYLKSTQQYNSSYVPPPWEQDTGYVVENKNQHVYQPPPFNTFTPKPSQPWQPSSEPSKYTKPKPTSYIPPAPNQSFVKPAVAVDQPKLPGRKTYYSEYERRYISVPESTYIPSETKYQPQPDASPPYYYDNNEPTEIVEPQWRKELREFTEKTQTTTQINETSVRPPWEEDPKYGNSPSVQSTPTWNQTLRPQSWRERSYEPEYTGAKEWPKTNTLGRGRPQSSYIKNNMNRIPERPRGVSVDRYNPNSYEPPIIGEHPPVQSQTLDHNIHPKPHYNPNVPGYHARASAEPREQSTYPQQRLWGDARATPIQSRSFKYLQWITGTED